MKFRSSVIVAYIGAAWALPQPPQTEGLIYVPCSSVTLFNAAYCCTRGLLGDVSDPTPSKRSELRGPMHFVSEDGRLLHSSPSSSTTNSLYPSSGFYNLITRQ
ncbi:hypothetical protein GGR55DRAFT_673086 [Xylaria sp. FL0064]|nr:hypothetical protein GGR55DRAFT_673086 [Xylaria sp. FL0064]